MIAFAHLQCHLAASPLARPLFYGDEKRATDAPASMRGKHGEIVEVEQRLRRKRREPKEAHRNTNWVTRIECQKELGVGLSTELWDQAGPDPGAERLAPANRLPSVGIENGDDPFRVGRILKIGVDDYGAHRLVDEGLPRRITAWAVSSVAQAAEGY